MHFSGFGSKFSIENFLNFRKFSALAARLERGLTEIEERIQKFVDTGENELRQKCEIFDQISNKEMKQTSFDHNFSKSAPFGPCFGMLSQFEAFLKMQAFAARSEDLSA